MDHVHRLVYEHRRLLAASLTGLAVLAALTSLRQTPDGVQVLIARHDLRSGHVIAAADVRTASVPADSAPDHTLARGEVIGRRVAGPMRAGEALTDFRVLQADSLAGYGTGIVFTTIRVDRADGASSVRVGDRVDVVAVDPDGETGAQVVARGVEVVTTPSFADSDTGSLGIATSEKGALALATAALEARFSVITTSWQGPGPLDRVE